ncbi:hypothetical protein TrVE_jg8098 [Triparma verrucosa]|uniref:N-acetyltransferase domain-containing protein n=1 Tax=Triparma verrucosa TaxID=1606542 RepID=A0A9W7BGS9_9STRA|nr:hypothetical protein TrVE_jg8098 [Triparma verrucosa]
MNELTSFAEVEAINIIDKVLVPAFLNYDAFNFIVNGLDANGRLFEEAPDIEANRSFLCWMFNKYLASMTSVGGKVYCLKDSDDGVASAASIVLPAGVDVPLTTMIWHGLWQLPFYFGVRALVRTIKLLDEIEELENKIKGQLGVMHLEDYLAVEPSVQGKGLGSKLLKAVLEKYNDQPLFLNTYSEGALRLYLRLGFVELGYVRSMTGTDLHFLVYGLSDKKLKGRLLPEGWKKDN